MYALMGAERLLEIAIHRRNARRLSARGATWLARDGFGPILAAQLLLFGLLPLEVALAPWAATGWWTWAMLGALALAQALRYWCILTLGERWSVRVVTVPGAPRVVRGPYRWLRHPNYLAVAVEVVALPLAFAAYGTAVLVLPLKLWALRGRIAREERALREAAPPPARA